MSDHDNIEDVREVIETETNLTYDVKVHTAEEIKQMRESLPKLGPLNKAMKIHEIHISSDGEVRRKFVPSDVFSERVKKKETKKARCNCQPFEPTQHRKASS